MPDYQTPLTYRSVQQIQNMAIPKSPLGHEFTLVPDAENTITLPIATHLIRINCAIPIYISIFPGKVNIAGPERFRFEGGTLPFVVADRINTIYIMNFTPAASDTIYFILGN